jgi:predicted transposase/invertase (TIGR01784 family)
MHTHTASKKTPATVLSAAKTQVFTIPTYDSAFKWILSSNEVRPSFFRSFIPGLIIQSSERLDDHMNPLRKSQLLRNFLHGEGTSRIVQEISSSGAYVVLQHVGKKRSPKKDDKATAFLSEIVGRFEEIRESFPQPCYDGKMDFACQLNTGEYALVEMQVIPEDYWDRRAFAYVAAFYGNQLKKGGRWKNIRKVMGLNILGGHNGKKVTWPDSPGQYMRHYKIEDQLNGKGRFIDAIELIQYSIMNAPLGDNQEKNDWITFFKSAHDMTEEDVAAQIKTPAVLQAFELAKFSKLPAEVRASYDDEGREYDRYSQHTAEQIRMAGKSGKIEGKIEVARKLLAMNLTMDQIEKATGLSSEDIKGIK